MNRHNNTLLILSGFSAVVAVAATLLLLFGNVQAEESVAAVVVDALPPEVMQWGFLAAALSTGLSALGAGIAVASVGSAAIGALAEKPELLGRSLIIIGLAEGIAIYGLIISILILNRLL
ncbi:ATP synthase subunit C [Solemya elarraichensis gill symbiont]|uniref:H+transporting two-sector ATPase C subunit n=1 Tax=Solemya elarraichensis gill symbiont TaxID=1918949 RepID=A0A1T2KWX6_9GAMM|nr:ATP synthase subunit C [Solemya elarraichensis gill symbiont]OOZ37256.1 H+transporting two-sector ATPase C subunit [Solemya elarraichensis gill symbiont]